MNSVVDNIRRLKVLLLLCSLLSGIQSVYADDVYLRGYLSSILEQQLGWQPDSYRIRVDQSVATIYVSHIHREQIEQVTQAFSVVPALIDFDFVEKVNEDQLKPPAYIHYPRGDYYLPAVADVKEAQFFLSFLRAEAELGNILLGSVGLGQNFGLYRWPASASDDGWQMNFFVSLFSQFNLDAPSDDLLNSDYLIGFPLSFRQGKLSGRLRFYHQSSHLGDEFLLSGNAPERVNLSLEAFDIALAYDLGYFRGMIGGTKIMNHNPADLDEKTFFTGLDYRNPVPIMGNSRFIAGIRTEWIEDVGWNSGTSIKFGLEIGQSYPERHGTRVMLEFYQGLVPFGQFYVSEVEYYGLGLYFDLN